MNPPITPMSPKATVFQELVVQYFTHVHSCDWIVATFVATFVTFIENFITFWSLFLSLLYFFITFVTFVVTLDHPIYFASLFIII